MAAPPGPGVVTLAVLAVKSAEALDQAEALTAALRSTVAASRGWSLGEAKQSLEFLAVQMKCQEPLDAACETRIADVIRADRFLWSVIELDSVKNEAVGALNLFVRGRGTNSVPIRFSATITSGARLEQEAAAWFEKVSGGAPNGGLEITTGGVAGQLYVDGKPTGAIAASGGTLQLPVGAHTLTIKAPGYEDATSQVAIQPLGTVSAVFSLIPAKKKVNVDGRMVAGLASLSAGLALGGVGSWAAVKVNGLRSDKGYQAYRDQFSAIDDVCEAARTNQAPRDLNPAASTATTVSGLCDSARRDELIQAIAFPAAAVVAGIGGYLLGTSTLGKASDDAKPNAWTIVPELSTERRSLTVRYAF